MHIIALSKAMFDRFLSEKGVTPSNVEDQNVAFISINNEDDTVLPYFPENKQNVKVLVFGDIVEDITVPIIGTGETKVIKAFTIEQARELYGFIKDNLHRPAFIVHCTAGISRSGAVATFINDLISGNYSDFTRNNPHILPNTLVLKLLRKAHEEVEEAEFEPFWLETEKGFFGAVNKHELPVLQHIHPDLTEILDSQMAQEYDANELATFGYDKDFTGMTLRQWLTERNMLRFFTSPNLVNEKI